MKMIDIHKRVVFTFGFILKVFDYKNYFDLNLKLSYITIYNEESGTVGN